MVETRRQRRGLPPLPKASSSPLEGGGCGDSSKSSSAPTLVTCNTSKIPTVQRNEPVLENLFNRNRLKKLNSKENKSTPRGAGQCIDDLHFLHGFEFDRCSDALSIPDPPSPGRVATRRFSSPIVGYPLREISNASDVEDEDERDSTNVTTRTKQKQTRKSLGHFESPVESSSATTQNVQIQPIKSTEKRPKESVRVERSSKRHKKRNSIVVPSELEPTDCQTDDEFTKAFASLKQEHSPPASPAKETKTPTKPSTNELRDLRKLVHAYTNLPKKDRDDSPAAQEIFASTGYRLRSAPIQSLNSTCSAPTALTREQKINFFMKLGPDLQKIDTCKVSDAKMVIEVTQCRPHKVRGGYYNYFHNETGRTVSPDEFEERYMMMLEEVNQIRSNAWEKYFDKLRSENEDQFASSNELCEDQEHMETQGGQACASNSEVHPDLPLSDKKSNLSISNVANSTLDDSNIDIDGEDDLLALSLPSRDETSNDPRIARAERKLWRSIDKALEEYSREVLAAQRGASPTPSKC